MKAFTKTLIALSALALATPFLSAQDNAAPDNPPPPPPHERVSPAERLDKMAKELSLTDDQKAKIKAIFQDEMTAGKALREDKSLSKDDRRAKMQALRKEGRAKIAAILTPEQLQKFEQMRDAKPPRPEHREPPAQ